MYSIKSIELKKESTITDYNYEDYIIKVVNGLLTNNLHNDPYFDLIFINITFNEEIPILNRLYRLVYVTLSNRDPQLASFKDKHVVCISLSEALYYIRRVTPPILKHKISSINTFDDIIDILQIYLIEQGGEYNIDTLFNILTLKRFETPIDINDNFKKKFEFIKTKVDMTKPIFIVQFSTIDIKTLIDLKQADDITEKDEFNYYTQGILVIDKNKTDYETFINSFLGAILGIFEDDQYIYLNIFNNQFDQLDLDLLKNTYGSLYN